MRQVKDIYVYIEMRNQTISQGSLQLLSLSQQLKKQYAHKNIQQQVIAVLCGYKVESFTSQCFYYGADRVIVIDNQKVQYPTTQHITKALVQIIETYTPECFLISASVVGRDIAPRVAATVRTGLTADATHLEVDPSDHSTLLLMTRPAFSGNLYGTIICPNTFPQMSSIREDVFEKIAYNNPEVPPTYVSVSFDSHDDVTVIQKIDKKKNTVDLTKANIILAGGRSMANHMDLLQDSAKQLSATLAASRGLVETQKVSKDIQVGQTGKTVRPSIYIACGISGAVQHTAGMENSQTIIAINNDPNASIFSIATLGVVADAQEVLKRIPTYL